MTVSIIIIIIIVIILPLLLHTCIFICIFKINTITSILFDRIHTCNVTT
jgi:hypothetical protein